jgi:hypothetical protein
MEFPALDFKFLITGGMVSIARVYFIKSLVFSTISSPCQRSIFQLLFSASNLKQQWINYSDKVRIKTHTIKAVFIKQ